MWVSRFQSFMVGRWLQTKTKKFHKFGWILWLCKDACILEHDFSFVQEDLSTSPFNTARLPRVVLFESVFSWLSYLVDFEFMVMSILLSVFFSEKNSSPHVTPPGRRTMQSRLSLLWRPLCPLGFIELGSWSWWKIPHRIRVMMVGIFTYVKSHKNQPFM